jgi:hypothetical protein
LTQRRLFTYHGNSKSCRYSFLEVLLHFGNMSHSGSHSANSRTCLFGSHLLWLCALESPFSKRQMKKKVVMIRKGFTLIELLVAERAHSWGATYTAKTVTAPPLRHIDKA